MSIDRDNKKIVLGISGGVDSTTAALLLLKEGYEVYGLYFSIKENDEDGKAGALRALIEAYKAVKPKIPTLDVENKYFMYRCVNKTFNDIVVNDFCNEYLNGRTPNPCIVCNPSVKFKLLVDAADEVGASYIATGHYADTFQDSKSEVSYIRTATSRKDQSYMLYRLPQEIVSRVVFPLAKYENKSEIREIAERMGMSNAKQSDSQEICFVPDDDYVKFISEWAQSCDYCSCDALTSGSFINKEGKVLGKHKGIVNYTIGQRKGLGIALGKPAYVTHINPYDNTVVLGDNEELFRYHVVIDNLFFAETDGSDIPYGISDRDLTAKVRYAAQRSKAKAIGLPDGTLEIEFEEAQRAMTPGQSVVIYDGELVIGGGRIIRTY